MGEHQNPVESSSSASSSSDEHIDFEQEEEAEHSCPFLQIHDFSGDPASITSMTAPQDPFYLVREEIQDSVSKVQIHFKNWEQLSKSSSEFSQLGKDIIAGCESIDWQVDELDRAISVSERDPARYGLDSAEIAQRKRWTSSTRNQISTMKKAVQDAEDKASRSRIELMGMPTRGNHALTREDEEFYGLESDKQALIMKEQDQDLDELSASVERIGGVGLTIHDELISQDRIISDLGQEMDNTANRLDFVQKRVALVIKKAGAKGQIMMIIFLVILLFILILLVFS